MDSDKELQTLLGDLGTLGFKDFTEDFFTQLNLYNNLFVTQDNNSYFIQLIYSAQVDPEMMKPKYKFMEFTLVYEKDKNGFCNEIMIRSARSTVSGEFSYVLNFYMNNLNKFVHEWNPGQEIFDITIEEKNSGPLTPKEFFWEFQHYIYYIFLNHIKS